MAGYDRAYTRLYTIEVIRDSGKLLIKEHLGVVADAIQKILDVRLIWNIGENGELTASMDVEKDEELPLYRRRHFLFMLLSILRRNWKIRHIIMN